MLRLVVILGFLYSSLSALGDESPEYTIEVFSLEECARPPHSKGVQALCKDLILTQAEGTAYKLRFSEGYSREIGAHMTTVYQNDYVALTKVPQILHPDSTSLWGHDKESLKILQGQHQKGIAIFAIPHNPALRGMVLHGKTDHWSEDLYLRVFPDRDPRLQKGIVISPKTPTMTLHHEVKHLTQDREGRSFRFKRGLPKKDLTIGETERLNSFADEFEAYIAGLEYLKSLNVLDPSTVKPLLLTINDTQVPRPLLISEYIAREAVHGHRAIGRIIRSVRPTFEELRSKSPELYCQVLMVFKKEFEQEAYSLDKVIPRLSSVIDDCWDRF